VLLAGQAAVVVMLVVPVLQVKETLAVPGRMVGVVVLPLLVLTKWDLLLVLVVQGRVRVSQAAQLLALVVAVPVLTAVQVFPVVPVVPVVAGQVQTTTM